MCDGVGRLHTVDKSADTVICIIIIVVLSDFTEIIYNDAMLF